VVTRGAIATLALALAACTTAAPDRGGPDASARPPENGVHFEPSPIEIVTEPAASWFEASCALPTRELRRIRRGYHPGRSPDVVMVPREPNFFGGFVATSHSGPWDYLQRVPLVFYGPGFIRPRGGVDLGREVTLADIAPTLAALVGSPWPRDRPGRVISEILVPQEQRPEPPRVVVTIVWDGGGWNVLDAWPGSWPNLARLMRAGASVEATVGSSPSVTPAAHANIGTGAWPKQHGIVGIPLRERGQMFGSFPNKSPKFLELSTVADLHDASTGNRARVAFIAYKSWHLAMLGHGAYLEGGDKDTAVIVGQQERFATGRRYYAAAPYLDDVRGLNAAVRAVDLDDGKLDDTWMGHEILDDPRARRDTPVWVLHQTKLVKAMLERESFGRDAVPDLFFTNYKQIDEVGHNWNMVNPEMRAILAYSDRALANLVRYLDDRVGKRRWVLALTADHGQGPDPEASGAWPIAMGELVGDLARRFGMEEDDLVLHTSPVGLWLHRKALAAAAIDVRDVAAWLLRYRLEDNAGGDEVPAQYEPRMREPIFSAAFPSTALGRIWSCRRSAR
jgi:predicted AlkP superfamily pyrophosphatase or phosphodiesterase